MWNASAPLYEYVDAANPPVIPIPIVKWTPPNKEDTSIKQLDLSSTMNLMCAATSPTLIASYVSIYPSDNIVCKSNSTSNLFYVICGEGVCEKQVFGQGDVFVLPSGDINIVSGSKYTLLYWVNDSPLLEYLSVCPKKALFSPIYFSKERLVNFVECIERTGDKNRLGTLLGNHETIKSGTLTVTPTLWALYNVLPAHSFQPHHRHNSVAIDLCIFAKGTVYTLIGDKLDANGDIVNPTRCEWISGHVFITPPGMWHSHHLSLIHI